MTLIFFFFLCYGIHRAGKILKPFEKEKRKEKKVIHYLGPGV